MKTPLTINICLLAYIYKCQEIKYLRNTLTGTKRVFLIKFESKNVKAEY